MQKLIGVLVYAKDEESALEAARKVVHEKLVYTDLGGPFDGYEDFTENPMKEPGIIAEESAANGLNDRGRLVLARSGKSRRKQIPPVLQVSNARYPIDDKRGLKMVNSAMKRNGKVFKGNMSFIRGFIANYTDDQLFDEAALPFQCFLKDASGVSPGPSAYLYDFQGRTISSPRHLKLILDDSDSNPWYGNGSEEDSDWGLHIWNQPLWVVPFDVHC
jgi:hypothetical protein